MEIEVVFHIKESELSSPAMLAFESGIDFLQRYRSRKAVSIFEDLVQIDPTQNHYQTALGLAYFFNGDYHESYNMLEKQVDLLKQIDIASHFSQYDYHKRKLRRYLEQNPNDQTAIKLAQLLP